MDLCRLQELQPSKESDEEGTDDGKQRDKKRKEVSSSQQTAHAIEKAGS